MRASFLHTFKFVAGAVLALGVLLSSGSVMAACTNPAGSAADMVYNGDQHVVQYCDGTNWIEAGVYGAGGTANCTSPAGSPGQTVYNEDSRRLQYCNGSVWVGMGAPPTVDGMIGHWKLDESAGTTVSDSHASYDGAFVNTPTWEPAGGQVDGDVDLDGTSDYIKITDATALSPSAFTVTMWVNPDVLQQQAFVKSADGSGWTTGWRITMPDSLGRISFNCGNGTTSEGILYADHFITANTWSHIAATYDGTTMKLYVNGVPGASQTASCAYGSNADMWFGLASGVPLFDGQIDDVQFYDRALTDSEIQHLFRSTSSNATPPTTSGLVGYWGFSEGTGTTAADSSGSGYDGTLADGIPTWVNFPSSMQGNALSFDGSGENVAIGTSFDVSLPMTISAWVNPTDYTDWRTIIAKRDTWSTSNARFHLWLNKTTGYVVLGNGSSTTSFSVEPEPGVWTHVVMVVTATATDLYINGELWGSQGGFTLGTDTAANTMIGANGESTPTDAYKGLLDEVRVYNRALNATEIRELFEYRGPGSCLSPAGDGGDLVYNTDNTVLQYCNGIKWMGVGK